MSRLAVFVVCALLVPFASGAEPAPAPARQAQAAPMAPSRALAEQDRARMALDRLAFGARPGEVERVRAMGVDRWIQRQLDPERIDDADLERRVADLRVTKLSTSQLLEKYPNPKLLMRIAGVQNVQALGDEQRKAIARRLFAQGYGRPREVYEQLAADRLLRATYSERQLQEVMVDFWSNHFNVYARKDNSQWYLPAFDRDTIRPHALGRFRDLLLATAQSPAMLQYLDNARSVGERPDAPSARRRLRGINENYARELMELHTLGVDGGYTQQDVLEVARALTGWTVADARRIGQGSAMAGGEAPRRSLAGSVPPGEFYFNPRAHSTGPMTVLGERIDAGGMQDGIAVIDLLARHPSTARFIARKLCEKFASDAPDPAMVARVAAAFTRSDGDIRATLSALFRDPGFFTAGNYRAKVKTPFELVASSLRALGAQSNGREVQVLLADLGQPLYGYQAPTGYGETAADWVNTGALIKRMNFAVALAANRIPGTHVDLAALGTSSDARAQLDTGLQNLIGGQVSEQTRSLLAARLHQPLPEAKLSQTTDEGMDAPDYEPGELPGGVQLLAASGDPQRVQVAALILGSPEFQRQ